MRSEVRAIATELVLLDVQLRPLLVRKDELRKALKAKLPVGDPEEVEGYVVHVYEKQQVGFDEKALLASLGDRADKVTVRKLDPEKLDSALQMGIISQEEIEKFVSIKVDKVLLCRPKSGNGNGNGAKTE